METGSTAKNETWEAGESEQIRRRAKLPILWGKGDAGLLVRFLRASRAGRQLPCLLKKKLTGRMEQAKMRSFPVCKLLSPKSWTDS